jgi:alpha-galactosidase
MIIVRDRYIQLTTKNTAYVMSHTDSGLLLHNYYGRKVDFVNYENVSAKLDCGFGTSVLYEGNPDEHLDVLELEFSTIGIGDYRESLIAVFNENLGYSANFKYRGYEILKSHSEAVPHSYDESEVLRIDLYDDVARIGIALFYKVFEESDVISRYLKITNHSDRVFHLRRCFSLQLDLLADDFLMMTFEGTWAKERHVREKELQSGIYINDSKTGGSSNRHNPLVIIKRRNTTENSGDCFGFNLVYSGNHKTLIEITPQHRMRVLTGINDHAFDFTLEPGGVFISPEAVITYSADGLNGLSQNFHSFINNHIIRGPYKNKARPVLLNSWEATYFKFNEKKLLALAKEASKIGIELFVLDDGWFGNRDDDTSSLGDWDVNYRKLPHGLAGLAKRINQMGMDFGLWVEPEMINEKSNLYREHPDWAVKVEGRKPGVSRNQLVLDLTNQEVRNYLIEKLTEVFSSCNLKYVKWDYNRNITDLYGSTLTNQGEFLHRYILGFYEIIGELVRRFPDILFEGCASGGNRFDLGMLCYFPQIWTSDNTDYLERLYIQTGTSYGYPLSAMTNHVSAVPNHQTLRETPLSSRFNLACFGNLGYELNLLELKQNEKAEIKAQINLYKRHRMLFQYGVFYRFEKTIFMNNNTYFYNVDPNGEQAVLGFFQELVHPAQKDDIIYLYGLKPGLYRFTNRRVKINLKKFGGLINFVLPVRIKVDGKLHNFICRVYKLKGETDSYLITDDALKYAGIRLSSQFLGSGFNNKVRVLGDFGSRLYFLNRTENK